MWTRARATGRDCQSCAAKGCTTRVYCGKCRRLVCLTCAGRVEMPLSAFGRCLSCVAGRHTTGLRWRVAQARLRVEELEYRSSSRRAWRRGVASLREYTDLTGERFFPCTVDTLLNWGAWALLARKPQGLDASTLRAYASGVDQMHAQAARGLGEKVLNPTRSVEWRRFARTGVRRLKKASQAMLPITLAEARQMLERGFPDTRSGRHRRIAFLFCTVGVLRKGTGPELRIEYRIRQDARGRERVIFGPRSDLQDLTLDGVRCLRARRVVDKNVLAGTFRDSFFPERIEALGVSPRKEILEYILRERPPSGGQLLAAPAGQTGFRTTRYSNVGKAVKEGYKRTFPSRDASRVGAQTCRKSMATWLWDDGRMKREIADIGGWSLRSRKDAVDVYFTTTPGKIVHVLSTLGRGAASRTREM